MTLKYLLKMQKPSILDRNIQLLSVCMFIIDMCTTLLKW